MFDKKQLAGLMQQAQDMQGKLEEAQQALEKLSIEGESGAGMVQVSMNGKYEVKKVNIDQSLLHNKEMLEDLIAAAFNDCAHKVAQVALDRMGDLAQNMPFSKDLLKSLKP